MSTEWENHEPAPIEFLHGKLHDYFHEFRRKKVRQKNTSVLMNGSDLARIIAKAKTDTYAKYPKQVNNKAILKVKYNMREFFTHYWVKGFGWETTVYQKEDFESVEKLGENKTDGIIFIAFDERGNSYTLKGYYAEILIESI